MTSCRVSTSLRGGNYSETTNCGPSPSFPRSQRCHRAVRPQSTHLVGPTGVSGAPLRVVIFTVTELIINARESLAEAIDRSVGRWVGGPYAGVSASVCRRRQRRVDQELCGPRYRGSHSHGDCHACRVSVRSVARLTHARTHARTHHPSMIKVSTIQRSLCYGLTVALASRTWRDRCGVIDYYNRVFIGRCMGSSAPWSTAIHT